MEEKRKEKRYLYQTLVKYDGMDSYEDLNAISINLSSKGISILSEVKLEMGHKFKLIFKLMNEPDPIKAQCEVVYTKVMDDKQLIGCKILELEGITRKKLKSILNDTFNRINIQ
jgi:hypothetical protein